MKDVVESKHHVRFVSNGIVYAVSKVELAQRDSAKTF